MMMCRFLVLIFYFYVLAANAMSFADRPDVQNFIARISNKNHFDQTWLTDLFSQVSTNDKIIQLITKPSESKPWYFYRSLFITHRKIKNGLVFWRENATALRQAEQTYGIPASLIVAIIGVETDYGNIRGRYKVLEALSTLAFDYPPRARFFQNELEQFLLLSREQSWMPETVYGSYAGAMGMPQFMPSNYRHYAVTFHQTHQVNLFNDPDDAISSIANYFRAHGWQPGQPVAMPAYVLGEDNLPLASRKPKYTVVELEQFGVHPKHTVAKGVKTMLIRLDEGKQTQYWLGFNNFYTIMRYNSSPLYAMAVYQLSEILNYQHMKH